MRRTRCKRERRSYFFCFLDLLQSGPAHRVRPEAQQGNMRQDIHHDQGRGLWCIGKIASSAIRSRVSRFFRLRWLGVDSHPYTFLRFDAMESQRRSDGLSTSRSFAFRTGTTKAQFLFFASAHPFSATLGRHSCVLESLRDLKL